MNDAIQSARKFGDLISLAEDASTEYQKAAIFAATESLSARFDRVQNELDAYALQKVEQVRWGICAALGYDISNGLDAKQHLSNAVASVNILIDVLTKSKTD